MQMILASQSPRRQALMQIFGVPFTVEAADVDEQMDAAKRPFDEVARVSRKKAEAISCGIDDIVIAADTIVVCEGQVLGKPRDDADAGRMLNLLSARAHQVMTGVTVRRAEKYITCTEVTDVYFRSLSQREIEAYIKSGETKDKAGSYGIQGGGALFVEKIAGDFYNVMGLPVCRLGQILRQIAPDYMEEVR